MTEIPRHAQTTLTIETRGVGLYPFSGSVDRWLREIGARMGMATIFCRHTSASLTIQENADPAVLHDLAEFFDRIAPENTPWFRHMQEGPDDMPAHIRSALTDVSLAIPVSGGGLALGTWQEIYLFEHRRIPHSRVVVLHYAGY
jgi:secondary thiamine-phosphate synthase enzyme